MGTVAGGSERHEGKGLYTSTPCLSYESECSIESVGGMKPQQEWLDELIRMGLKGIYLASSWHGKPSKWIGTWDWDWRFTAEYRSIQPNELIFDIDIDHKRVADKAREVIGRLEEMGIPHWVYDSGGKGYHIQVFLKPEDDITDWKLMRETVANEVLKGIVVKERVGDKWQWVVDPRKYSWRDNGGSLLRIIGGRKYSYKYWLKDGIREPRVRAWKPIWDFPQLKYYIVPKEIKEQYYKKKKEKDLILSNSEIEINIDEVPICIEDLVEKEMAGWHLSHLQRIAIVTYYYLAKGEKIEAELLKIFAHDPRFNEDITRYQIRNIIETLKEHPERRMGCRFMREYDVIDKDLCLYCPLASESHKAWQLKTESLK